MNKKLESWCHRVTVGALVGGVVGCLSRPAVVAAFWESGVEQQHEHVVVPILAASCVIGVIIGAIAGALGGSIPKPIIGGALGATIGGTIGGVLAFCFSFFTIPILCLASNRRDLPINDAYLYFALMTLTGIVPGALGGLAGELLGIRRNQK